MNLLPVEPPTQPTGLSIKEEQLYEAVLDRAMSRETKEAERQIDAVLKSGEGVYEALNWDGRKIQLDAGQLYERLTEDEESEDLAVLLAFARFPDDQMLREKAHRLASYKIRQLAQERASEVAYEEAQTELYGGRNG